MNNNHIDLAEAVSITGLTKSTLERFREAGCLKATEDNGIVWFDIKELESTFGIKVSRKRTIDPEKINITSSEDSINKPERTEPLNKSEDFTVRSENKSERTSNNHSGSISSIAKQEADLEIFKLNKVIELQEKVLEIKDNQINSLNNQVKWLQERIEKLEEKAEKDQLLLLNESRIVARLVEQQGQKRNPFKFTLDWFGNKSKTDNKNLDDIEIKK